jgi:hypothetical protein
MVVAFLLLLAPLHVSLVQAAPGPASPATLSTAKTKLERPRFTPSDVNGRSSYLDESDVSSIAPPLSCSARWFYARVAFLGQPCMPWRSS